MQFILRFPIIVWFLIIALLTGICVSYFTYEHIFHEQIRQAQAAELRRVNQRLIQLQGTVNDFNRRQDYNAIHREISRLSSDPSMELIAIVDEHGYVRYSSLIEYRNTDVKKLTDVYQAIEAQNSPNLPGNTYISTSQKSIQGVYPLDLYSDDGSDNGGLLNAYLYARFDISHTLSELRYRQQQEISQIAAALFSLLLGGFLLLYLAMRRQIRTIITGINHFSDGDYDARIKLSGSNEFSDISKGFDSMAAKLQAQNRSLLSLTDKLKQQHHELSLQEQDLRITLNSIGDAVIATDSQGLITRMNPVAQSLTGWSIAEAEGQPITRVFNIFDSASHKAIENPIEKVIKTGETVFLSNSTTLLSRDGTEYHISDSAAPIRDESNSIQGMVLIFNDITEQYKLREIAARSERLLRSIMDNSPAVIYVKNREARFTYVNRSFQDIFHTSSENIIGKTPYDLVSAETAEVMQQNDKKVLVFGETLELEETLSHDGALHTYSSVKFPLLDENGNIYAVCGISTDITERKQQEQLLRRTQKMDALGKLTGGIAHDYNNMLGVINGYSELLKNALSQDPKLHKFASEIQRASERGANLTKKLLAFSRPQQSENESLKLNALIHDREDMLQKVLTARISLKMDLDDDLWPVWINSGDMEDAIVNMCINAMHAMEDGGQLTIETRNQHIDAASASQLQAEPGDYVLLAITDTGIGMDRVTQEKIFDPFFSSKGDLGAGLGLSQVYGLVKNNGGFIKVDSEPGHGTRMAIYLPRHDGVHSAVKTIDENITNNVAGSETVLIVDDESSLCELAEHILSQQGYRVFTAENAMQALAVLENHPVDILFSDVIMPEMNGYQLASKVQQIYPHIKILLTSGYNDNRHMDASLDELHARILNKPYAASDLLRSITELARPA